MNGQDVKTLNVYVKTRSLGNVRWTISGNQGAQWNVGQVTVRGVRQPYSVSTGGQKFHSSVITSVI